MVIKDTEIALKIGKKAGTTDFAHVVVEPGHVAVAPTFGRFYEMSGLNEHWFRDSVRYSTAGTNKNAPAKHFIAVWGADAHVTRRNCGGALVCAEEGCMWAVTRRNKQGAESSDRKCPVHGTLQESQKCGAVFYIYKEICNEPGKQRHGILTFGSDHCHGPWAVPSLLASSKALIEAAVKCNPRVTYRQLATGKGIPGHDPAKGSLARIDPAFSNMGQVTDHIRRVRKELDVSAAGTGLSSLS